MSSPNPATAAKAPRQTQAQRRAQTRAKILEAVVDCLKAEGYAGTTTTAVGKRAAVSQGAVFAHFPTKAELVAGGISVLFARLITDFRGAFSKMAGQEDFPLAVINALWEVFCSSNIAAAFEIYVAARTDESLAQELSGIAEAHRENIRSEAKALFPQLLEGSGNAEAQLYATLDVVIYAMQGAALGSSALPSPEATAPMLARLAELVRHTTQQIEA